ncbi:type IV pilus modification protein PilV [Chitinibacter sp. FCG-7]|uniref:Type IV pilus modification protein PilV n=1 Tax=Chitinibacter mangrovi TaxID=3153927 RepID=A0AAU7F745_9NEIS
MRHKQKGIGLIEVLIALVVIGISVLALTSLQGQTLKSSAYNKQRVEAQAYAYQALERIRAESERANCSLTDTTATVTEEMKVMGFIDLDTLCNGSVNGSHNKMSRTCSIALTCKAKADGSDQAVTAGKCPTGVSAAEVVSKVRWDGASWGGQGEVAPVADQYVEARILLTDYRKSLTFKIWNASHGWEEGDIVRQGNQAENRYFICYKAEGCPKPGFNQPKNNDADGDTNHPDYWKKVGEAPYCSRDIFANSGVIPAVTPAVTPATTTDPNTTSAPTNAPTNAPTAAPTAAPTIAPTATPAGVLCATWSTSLVYTAGNIVKHTQGQSIKYYLAKQWTQGQNPNSNNGPSGSGKPWTEITQATAGCN